MRRGIGPGINKERGSGTAVILVPKWLGLWFLRVLFFGPWIAWWLVRKAWRVSGSRRIPAMVSSVLGGVLAIGAWGAGWSALILSQSPPGPGVYRVGTTVAVADANSRWYGLRLRLNKAVVGRRAATITFYISVTNDAGKVLPKGNGTWQAYYTYTIETQHRVNPVWASADFQNPDSQNPTGFVFPRLRNGASAQGWIAFPAPRRKWLTFRLPPFQPIRVSFRSLGS